MINTFLAHLWWKLGKNKVEKSDRIVIFNEKHRSAKRFNAELQDLNEEKTKSVLSINQ